MGDRGNVEDPAGQPVEAGGPVQPAPQPNPVVPDPPVIPCGEDVDSLVMRLREIVEGAQVSNSVADWRKLAMQVAVGALIVAALSVVFTTWAPEAVKYMLAGVAIVGIVTSAALVWKVAPVSDRDADR